MGENNKLNKMYELIFTFLLGYSIKVLIILKLIKAK